ncbi:PTS sugar transporter subunit IIA [Candidatus Enterococcus ferrettii]|uniref:PTS system, mannose-specific IIA component n=1 Tax=Candidatus Enterococcus ferrettii TaxID=2815324 RepID=A0ABV0ESQ6_9ENTE|nr:PTS sugar transporter subunit IIA [Enterococcus sp. 665A]MBO1342392.1 PTS sugar transporter subunit IIA [Enterococcus sp. 665A]
MIQIVIAAHGSLSEGLKSAIELIMGESENLHTFSLYQDTGIELFGTSMQEKIEAIRTAEGTIVFTDLFGASPYNQATLKMKNIQDMNYRIISGVNLPMVIECLTLCRMGVALEDLWQQVLDVGKEGIKEFEQEFEKHVMKRGD